MSEIVVLKDVREQRQEAVAEEMPEQIRALRPAAREARAEDDVGSSAFDRLDQLRDAGRVVLHVRFAEPKRVVTEQEIRRHHLRDAGDCSRMVVRAGLDTRSSFLDERGLAVCRPHRARPDGSRFDQSVQAAWL
jgi:hypothetical protein